MYLLKPKQMQKGKSMKIFWARKFFNKNEKEREILETLLWIFTCSYNTTIAFHNSILKYENLFSMLGPNFVKE